MEAFRASAGGGPEQFRYRVKVTKGYCPSFSPDGKRIAYEGYAVQDSEIFTISAGGGRRVNVTRDDTLYFNPSWEVDRAPPP
jgi:Tol biopolymer transport system component